MRADSVVVYVVLATIAAGAAGSGLATCSCVTQRDRAVTAERRARAAESRIVDACQLGAAHIEGTLAALAQGELGLALAARDAALVPLCGGDADAVESAVIRRDIRATKDELRALQRAWLAR